MSDDSESSSCSSDSSYDESESSSERPSARAWTCDDIYPTKDNKALGSDSGESSEDSESSVDSPAKGATADDDSSDADISEGESESSEEEGKPKPRKERAPLQRQHSSDEIAVTISEQNEVLKKAAEEEERRRQQIRASSDQLRAQSEAALNLSNHMDEEFKSLTKEYDSSDEAMEKLQNKLEEKRNSAQSKSFRQAENSKFQRKNMEREMRLAKARERIEKKKDEEAAAAAQARIKEKEGYGKLDMSKAARVERAYSWYSRMAMPTREKMKQRVEYMPASSGVTPDDVDLLPWNARGTFVSVAAMMRMNRTCASSTKTVEETKKSAGSDSDSDSD
jgi:hypothetical protein